MKWYWILLIVVGAFVLGALIYMAMKPKVKVTATKISSSAGPGPDLIKTSAPANVKVDTGNGTEVVKTDNLDGTKTVSIARIAH